MYTFGPRSKNQIPSPVDMSYVVSPDQAMTVSSRVASIFASAAALVSSSAIPAQFAISASSNSFCSSVRSAPVRPEPLA